MRGTKATGEYHGAYNAMGVNVTITTFSNIIISDEDSRGSIYMIIKMEIDQEIVKNHW